MSAGVRRVAIAVAPVLGLAAAVYSLRDAVGRWIVDVEAYDYRYEGYFQQAGFIAFLVLAAAWVLAVALWKRPQR